MDAPAAAVAAADKDDGGLAVAASGEFGADLDGASVSLSSSNLGMLTFLKGKEKCSSKLLLYPHISVFYYCV